MKIKKRPTKEKNTQSPSGQKFTHTERQEIEDKKHEKFKKKRTSNIRTIKLEVDRSDIDSPAVQDKQAYGEWKRLAAHRLLNEDQVFYASDGTEVNLGWFPSMLVKRVEHLSEEEREEIRSKKKQYMKLMALSGTMKSKAYGYGFKQKNRLSEDGLHKDILSTKKHEIIELFGRMFSPQEVQRVCVEQYRIPCSLSSVKHFRVKFAEQISEKISNFKKEIGDMRLSNKRGRLEELIWLYATMKREYEDDKTTFKHKALVGNLEQIRKEVEGDSLRVEGDFMIKLEANLNQHLQIEIFKQININQIIVGRVASRLGASPEMVIASLMDSYYKGITGIVDTADEAEYDTIEFPSVIPYDFGKIQKVQAELQKAKKDKSDQWKQYVAEENQEGEKMGLKEKLLQIVERDKHGIKEKEEGVELSTYLRKKKHRKEEEARMLE